MESSKPEKKVTESEESIKARAEFEAKRKAHQTKRLKEQGKDSAHNSEEDQEVREAREDQEDEEAKDVIEFTPLGGEECPLNPEEEEIEYSMMFRIPKIENLEKCTKLKALFLRKNLITKIEGLDQNHMLE